MLGALIVNFQASNRIGWLCGWIALGLLATEIAFMGVPCNAAAAEPAPGLPIMTWALYSFSALFVILPLFILLPLLFPTGRFLSRRWAWASAAGVLLLFLSGVATSLVPDFRQDNAYGFYVDLDNPFGVAGLPAWWRPTVRGAALLVACALCFMAIASMIVRLRRSVGDERQQMKWLTYFLATAVTTQLLVFELPGGLFFPQIFHMVWYDLMIGVVIIGFPVTIGIAIFKYRLYDIDVIINRTLVYGALTLMVVAVYMLIVAGSSRLFHFENNLIASLVATGMIAVLFHPMRVRLQGMVNRWLYGERDDPAGVLTRLTSQLEKTGSGESLLAVLVETIASSLKLPYVALWLSAQDGNLELAAGTGAQPAHVETLPLMHQGETLGQLAVAPRAPGEALSAADRQLLTAIARLTATTARTIQLTDQVQGRGCAQCRRARRNGGVCAATCTMAWGRCWPATPLVAFETGFRFVERFAYLCYQSHLSLLSEKEYIIYQRISLFLDWPKRFCTSSVPSFGSAEMSTEPSRAGQFVPTIALY